MKLLRHTVFNLVGLGAPLLVAVATIPVLIGQLGPSRFGLLTLIWAVVSYFGLFDLGLGRALTQQLAVVFANQQHKQAVNGISDIPEFGRSIQESRHLNAEGIAAPQHQRQVVEHEGNAQRQQHLSELGTAHEPQQSEIYDQPDQGDTNSRPYASQKEIAGEVGNRQT